MGMVSQHSQSAAFFLIRRKKETENMVTDNLDVLEEDSMNVMLKLYEMIYFIIILDYVEQVHVIS